MVAPDDIEAAKGAEKPHYHGHRDRLRRRFTEAGSPSLADYELLELLLFSLLPRRDVKPLAKSLIARFGGLSGVLNGDLDALTETPGLGPNAAVALKTIKAMIERVLRSEVMQQPVLSSWRQLLDYCQVAMAHSIIEEFRLLFLDRKNALIADEVQQTGTIDHTPVYPREVIKRALELGASAVILVHNHPSGDPTPSKADIELTREIARAAGPLGLQVHDHLIIGRGGKHASLKSLGLI